MDGKYGVPDVQQYCSMTFVASCTLQTLSCAQAAARRQRLDGIRGNPRPRFGYDPWQHPDLPPDGGIQEGIYGGVDASSEVWGAVKPAKRNGGEHFMQTKVGDDGTNVRGFLLKNRTYYVLTLNHYLLVSKTVIIQNLLTIMFGNNGTR